MHSYYIGILSINTSAIDKKIYIACHLNRQFQLDSSGVDGIIRFSRNFYGIVCFRPFLCHDSVIVFAAAAIISSILPSRWGSHRRYRIAEPALVPTLGSNNLILYGLRVVADNFPGVPPHGIVTHDHEERAAVREKERVDHSSLDHRLELVPQEVDDNGGAHHKHAADQKVD